MAASVSVLLSLFLVACGSESEDAPQADDASSGFPISVEHKFGVTEIPSAPKRVVTVGYNDQDAVLALGVKPVASVSWFEEKVVYPWSQQAADAAGGDDIELITAEELESGGPEAIAAYKPDLIVAIFSFLTEDDYKEYSKIAPTIVGLKQFPNDGTPWQEQTKLVGQALGKSDEADRIVADAEDAIAAIAERNPEFKGKSAFAGSGLADGQVGLYPTGRAGSTYEGGAYGPGYLLPALGFEIPAEFDKLSDKVTAPLLSYELINKLDTDVGLWTFPREEETAVELNKIPTYKELNLVKEGRDVFTDQAVGVALNFSTLLSLPWAAAQLEPQLVAALDGDPSTSSDLQ
ncbi:ABC transporter substrate-binding protein [Brevibacterium sp. Mu109]|uniref:ABC transporter substrate-binding protein n=1 Tax=Brevibacterium sp. Mu109 TaxID=1255669 RepID=UPI0015E1451B|nr:ABC transporter substrate-binding protein [Brevibacterium sp. Mu109]MDN5894585.1 ABC transporter substrate-binding protein [Nocardioides sp.]